MKNLPFNWERDFAPVTLVVYAPNLLVTNNAVPASSVAELIAYARKTPAS